MADAMLCAECGPPVPAAVLVVVPDLFHVVAPACAEHGQQAARAGLDVIPLDGPDAVEALASYTILRAVIVPRPGGVSAGDGGR